MDGKKFGTILRISLFIVMASLILSYPVTSNAALGKSAEEKAAEEARKKAEEAEKARKAAIDKKRNMINKVKESLSDTLWNIDVKRLGQVSKKGANSPESFKDILRFVNSQVKSDTLSKDGFNYTNFSIRVKEDRGPTGKDLIIWETMQTTEDKGLAFWRGEYEEGDTTVRGALSRHYDEENVDNYTFTGVQGEFIGEGPAAAEVVPAAPAAEMVPVAPAAEPVPAPSEKVEVPAETTAPAEEKTEQVVEKTEEKIEPIAEKAAEVAPAAPKNPEVKTEEPVKEKKKKTGLW